MERVELDSLVDFNYTNLLRALTYKNKAKAYLILCGLKQNGQNYTTDLQIAKLMGIDYSYAYQILRYFENMELLKRLPTRKPRKFAFLGEMEDNELILLSKRTIGLIDNSKKADQTSDKPIKNNEKQ